MFLMSARIGPRSFKDAYGESLTLKTHRRIRRSRIDVRKSTEIWITKAENTNLTNILNLTMTDQDIDPEENRKLKR